MIKRQQHTAPINYLATAILLMLSFVGIQLRAENSTQPNIVFILADDLGWSDTTLFDTTKLYETPDVQRLAERARRVPITG